MAKTHEVSKVASVRPSFIRSIGRSLDRSLIPSSIRSFVRLFVRPSARSFVYSFVRSLDRSLFSRPFDSLDDVWEGWDKKGTLNIQIVNSF